MNVNLKSLVERLNDVSRGALEGAAGLCLSRTNYDVEVEHILAKILENNDTDLHKIASHYEINIDRLNKDVSTALDKLKTGNSRTPGLSDRITEWIQNAWLVASVDFGAASGSCRIAYRHSRRGPDFLLLQRQRFPLPSIP